MPYMIQHFIKNPEIGLWGTEGLGFILLLIMTILSIEIVLYLATYLCKGIGLYTMAKRENKSYPWLAFIPVVRYYLQGELCGDIEFGKKKVRDVGIWLVVIPFLEQIILGPMIVLIFFAWILMGVSYEGMSGASRFAGSLGFSAALLISIIVVLAAILLEAICKTAFILVNQRVFGKYTSETMRTVHAVLGALVPMYEAAVYLALRNRPEYGTEAACGAEQACEPEAEAGPESVRKPEAAETYSVAGPEIVREPEAAETDTAAGSETTEE